MPPNSLERLLKSLEGHVVDSVELERKEGFLHVKLSVRDLQDPQGEPKDLSFSVMWKRSVDEMLDRFSKTLKELNSKFEKQSAELAKILERKEHP